MTIKPKRPRLGKSTKPIDQKMYQDFNQQKPNPDDPNEVEKTPLAPLPNSGAELPPLKEDK